MLSASNVITISMYINKRTDKSKKLIQMLTGGPQRKIGVDIVEGMVNKCNCRMYKCERDLATPKREL